MLKTAALASALTLTAVGAHAACPSFTVSIPFQTSAVAAGSGTLTDGSGNTYAYTTPAVAAGSTNAAPVTITPNSCSGGTTAYVTGETSLGSLRNDYNGHVGFKMTVGSAALTVTDVGRLVVSGNSGSHTIELFNNSCQSLGSASINTSGATAGAFLYAPLSAPITLAANQSYYVFTTETGGGDQFRNDSGTVLTSTSAAALVHSAYIDGSGNCVNGTASGATNAFGIPNFKYQ